MMLPVRPERAKTNDDHAVDVVCRADLFTVDDLLGKRMDVSRDVAVRIKTSEVVA